MRLRSDFFQNTGKTTRLSLALSGLILVGFCVLSGLPAEANNLNLIAFDPETDGAQIPPPSQIKQRGGGDNEIQFQAPAGDSFGSQNFRRRAGKISQESSVDSRKFARKRRLAADDNDNRPVEMMPQGAEPPGPGFKMRSRFPEQAGGFQSKRLSRQLDLTPLGLNEEQKTKIQQMREQSRSKVKDLHSTLISKQTEVRNLMFSPEASETQIKTARKELRKLQEQMDDININDLLSIRALLTPEQKKRLPDCMPQSGTRHQSFYGDSYQQSQGQRKPVASQSTTTKNSK